MGRGVCVWGGGVSGCGGVWGCVGVGGCGGVKTHSVKNSLSL